jgi:hypothetical protein
LADLGQWDEALDVLPPASSLKADPLHDPAAQRAAISARCWVRHDPARATDQATWALVRPAARFPVSAAWIYRDVAAALRTAGHTSTARSAAKQGLKQLQGTGADGIRLELLGELYRAEPETRIVDAAQPLVERIRRGLHGAQRTTFDTRSDLAWLG